MKNIYLTLALMMSCILLFSGCKKDEEVDPNGSKVKFTIDGKSYEGSMYVTASSVTSCSTSKAIVITDETAAHTITLLNYKSSSDSVYDPLIGDNRSSCTKITFGVTDGSASNGYFSTSGSWQVSGSTFTLTATAKVPSGTVAHTITATGKLQ